MPKAVILPAHGGPETLRLEDRAPLSPGPGEILVRNRAAGLNFIDIYQRKGLYPLALPAVLGAEGSGSVAAVGDGVREFRAGDRVAFLGMGGAYAEETLVPAGMAARLPDAIADETAAAAFLKGLTAVMLADEVFPLAPGRTALVHAAAGGVGLLLCQWAKAAGARVIGVVGAPAKAHAARAAGADEVILREEGGDLAGRVRALTGGRGVDVVYDSVGAATFTASLDSLAMRGMMVSYGNASGPVPPVAPLELSRRGSLFLTRPTLFHYATPGRLQKMAEGLFARILSGALAIGPPRLFPLADAAAAHTLLEGGTTTGAIVLKV